MEFLTLAQSRYTSKAYDATKKISPETLQQFLEILRLSPSSINIQPWHFIVAQSEEAKKNISLAMPNQYAYNIPKILNASEVIIFTAKIDLDEQHLDAIITAEEQAGRFRTPESKQAQKDARTAYVKHYKEKDVDRWIDSQLHIALGNALCAAKALNLDATPIAGFDINLLNQSLNLAEKGLRSVVLLALGYRSDEDFNANLPKARLALETITHTI